MSELNGYKGRRSGAILEEIENVDSGNYLEIQQKELEWKTAVVYVLVMIDKNQNTLKQLVQVLESNVSTDTFKEEFGTLKQIDDLASSVEKIKIDNQVY